MKEAIEYFQIALAFLGGCLGFFFGKMDGLFITLVVFVIIDYITGIVKGIIKKKLNSETGFKGILKKIIIFLIVGIANLIDVNILGASSVLRTAIIFFYISNEGISIIENASKIGLPIPEKLKEVLEQLHDKSSEDKNGEKDK